MKRPDICVRAKRSETLGDPASVSISENCVQVLYAKAATDHLTVEAYEIDAKL